MDRMGMSTKDRILELLEKNRGENISGEELASLLGITRSAVWKAVKSLQKDGYSILAASGCGYSLSDENNILSLQSLLPYLADESFAERIHVYKSVESTNKTAKEMAVNGCGHGVVVIADSQTAGKGRYGRSFFSPSGSGVYMSFVLHSREFEITDVTKITSSTAVAVCSAVEAVTGKRTEIKWVNDVLLDNRKICGILTEAITDFESGSIDWVVIGIGVNIDTVDFPSELNQIAASIFPGKTGGAVRNRIAAEIINIILTSNAWLNDDEKIFAEYRSRLSLLGQPVTVYQANEVYDAVAVDIDEDRRLLVRKADGSVAALSSGEVSVKRRAV